MAHRNDMQGKLVTWPRIGSPTAPSMIDTWMGWGWSHHGSTTSDLLRQGFIRMKPGRNEALHIHKMLILQKSKSNHKGLSVMVMFKFALRVAFHCLQRQMN